MGNKSEGVRGILDDLLKRIGPDDTVVLSSDHGFVELLPGDAVEVAEAEAVKVGRTLEATVRWRYIEGLYERPAGTLHLSPGLGTTFVPFRFLARPEATELILESRP